MNYGIMARMLRRNTISKLRGFNKKTYQVLLCGIFSNVISGKHGHPKQQEYFLICDELLNGDFQSSEGLYKNFLFNLQQDFKVKGFKRPKQPDTINTVIAFFRTRVNEYINKQKTLFLASELEGILDAEKFFENVKGKINVLPHHWIDFNLTEGLIPTFPEMFTYQDLITLWNKYVETLEFNSDNPYRMKQRDYELASLYRFLTVSAVTFVESYLYYLFYNLKYDKEIRKSSEVRVLINRERLEDTQIFEGILCKVYPALKNEEHIWKMYKNYLDINSLRNKYVHASVFADRSDKNISSLQPLLFWNHNQLVYNLNDCINFVLEIEDTLSEKHKILKWWETIANPEFKLVDIKKAWLLNKQNLIHL